VGLLLRSSAIGQDAGVELFHRMQHALGGPEKIASIHDFEHNVKASTWNSNGQPIRSRNRRPGTIREHFAITRDLLKEAFFRKRHSRAKVCYETQTETFQRVLP
jgi:hypothetical protein